MAGTSEEKQYSCITDGCNESFMSEEQLSVHKNKHGMVLNLGTKSSVFSADQTPTPIRFLRNCEEVGLFQDLQNVNPFEETFRKAAEGIRSGSTSLEMSSLTVTSNNGDDSLHTPHVIFPTMTDMDKPHSDPPPELPSPLVQPGSTDPICLSLDAEVSREGVIQQEADTSEDTQNSHMIDGRAEGGDDLAQSGTVQFLLRMPDGKLLQLSSLPVEPVQAATAAAGSRDIPIIKVNSASDFSSKSVASSSGSSTARSGIINVNNYALTQAPKSHRDTTKQNVTISLAKQKLKEALMSNSCPAATASSSSSNLNNIACSSAQIAASSKPMLPRRPASVPDDFNRSDDSQAEEKRRRNRAAAMRCREKRKTWVQELERRANDMMRTNGQLQYEVSLLRDEVAQLKTLLLAHRDCPVTQALVQGQSENLPGMNVALSVTNSDEPASKTVNPKRASAVVMKASTTPIKPVILLNDPPTKRKPVILLNDPPTKRKRLQAAGNATSSTVPTPTTSTVSASPMGQTLVIASVPNCVPKSTSVLNPNFVSVIPSVLVANPGTGTSGSGATQLGTSSQAIALSSVVPAISTRTPSAQKQTFILPKSVNSWVTDDGIVNPTKQTKLCAHQILSSNVIKVNPNAVDRETSAGDSDIEVIDIRTNER